MENFKLETFKNVYLSRSWDPYVQILSFGGNFDGNFAGFVLIFEVAGANVK